MKNNFLRKYMNNISKYCFAGYYKTIFTDLEIGDAVFFTRKGGIYPYFKECADYFGISSWLSNSCQIQCEEQTTYWVIKNMVVHPVYDEIICHLTNLKGENVMIKEKSLTKRHLSRGIKLKLQEKFNFEDFSLKRLTL